MVVQLPSLATYHIEITSQSAGDLAFDRGPLRARFLPPALVKVLAADTKNAASCEVPAPM
jgi:hypothetical protein